MHRISLLFFLAIPILSAGQDGVPLLKWAGPPGSRPGTCEEWLAEHPYTPFYFTLDRALLGDGRTGSVAILTELNLAQYLNDEIHELSETLQNEGYTVYSYQVSGGMPETLKTFLQQLYSTDSIEGALFVGNLPVAWFEALEFGGEYTEFPIDLFYMDLDGEWLDTMNTGNGRYDGHVGDLRKPEIYVGRLTPTGMGIDTTILKRYFLKDHNYRVGLLNLPKRALVFVDDDWYPWAWQWANNVSLLFSDTTNYFDPETTRASFYRQRLDSMQTWVSVFAHSWPGGNQFVFNNGNQHDYYYSPEYVSQNPPTNFYNFFACSFCRYTSNGYGGGRAIFNDSCGIGSIGSTKTGSMLDFNYFYRPLGQGGTLGQAFKYWFECIYDSVGMSFDRICWHYGMTLLGDPFLRPKGHSTAVAESPRAVSSSHGLSMNSSLAKQQISLTLNLETAQHVSIILYDCIGRQAGELANRELTAGTHQLTMQLKDVSGRALPSGIYVLQAAIGNHLVTRKIIKID